MMQNRPVHILLADDDEDDISLFREALEQIQISTKLHIAENGRILISTLMSDQVIPDIIFLDMNMPFKNGLECLTEIRNSDNFKETLVIIFSTSVADYLLRAAYRAGANLYIQKPTSFSGLIEIIKKCLKEKDDLKNIISLEQFLIRNSNN